jgi:hypothetical protein
MRLFIVMAFFLSGCANQVAWLVGAEPVTKERCQKLDVEKMGLDDGLSGQRPYEKLDFWKKDCRALGAEPNRETYKKSYDQGFLKYCSCERGVEDGIKGRVAELTGQLPQCGRENSKNYYRGLETVKTEIEKAKGAKLEVSEAQVRICQSLL